MTKATAGSIVGIYYDGRQELKIRDCLQTPTGRVYVIVELRRQLKGRHIGRWHIRALVSDTVPAGTENVYLIVWYKREKKRGYPK
jgi:hypothetical protein